MASVLYCDPDVLGREQRIYCEAELGSASPLEFEEGHALVEDEQAADRLVNSRPPVEYAGSASNPGNPDYFESVASPETASEFDAEAFVDRTPMDGVIEDIESGEYDEHLEAIAEAATRVGVEEAVDERRA